MEITITRVDGAMRVTPAPPYLTDYLQYSHRSFETKHWQKVNKFERIMLHATDGSGGITTLPGFFEHICRLIHKHSDRLNVDDRRTVLPELDLAAIRDINWEAINSTGLRDYQLDPVLEFLYKGKENSGIVNATGGYGKTIVQAVTYAAFNKLNTILAIPVKEVVSQTHEKFRKLFPNKHIGKVGDGSRDISSDITISTFKSLNNCAIEKCQLLLVDEIQSTTSEGICDILTGMAPIRTFGYTATDEGMFNQAEKVIKGLFGDRLIHIPYRQAEEVGAVVPGLVYFVQMPDNVMISAGTVEGKISKGIKNCVERNKLIAEVCSHIPEQWQTIVFVDHINDHLINLYKEMPRGTKYLHRNSNKKELGDFALKTSEQNKIISQFKENDFQYLIATDAFRAGVDVPNCRVVVQGAGGNSEIEIMQEALRGSRILSEHDRNRFDVSEKTHFVLIDILDTHDSTLENMSYKRMETYRKQGWKIKIVKEPKDIDWYDYHKDKL